MEWALDHLQLIIAIAGAVAWWLTQRKQAQAASEEPPPEEESFGDPELAERTRRIREEIQRKIEQRSRDYTQPAPRPGEVPVLRRADIPPQATPPILPEFTEVFRESARQPELPPASRATTARLDAQRTAEILEQQAALTAQLKQAEEMKAARMRRAQFESKVSGDVGVAAVARGALADDLRNPDALRRAFIMREILGPPVALRN